mgnify:CR=1 FL=1
MPKMRLTDAAVKRLKPPADGQVEYFDELLPGFGLRISSKGRKAWVLFYRPKAGPKRGKLRRMTLEASADALPLAQAREQARDVFRRVELGEDPADDRKRARDAVATAKTVAEAVDQFIERYAKPRNRDWRETQRLLDKNVVAEIGTTPIADVTRADLIDIIDKTADRAPFSANRTLSALRKMMRWHVERGTIETSPAEGISPPTKEVDRDRVLTEAELRWFWQATGAEGFPFGALFRLLLTTAQRLGEATGGEWAEISIEERLWRIPRGRTKGDRAHEVALSPISLEVLEGLPRIGRLLFSTSEDGGRPVAGMSRAKKRIVVRMQELADAEGAGPIPDWRLHDLRRTAGTGMASSGVPVSTISRVLNHAEGGVTKVYNRFSYGDEKRDALERWGRKLEAIIGVERDNVVALKATGG